MPAGRHGLVEYSKPWASHATIIHSMSSRPSDWVYEEGGIQAFGGTRGKDHSRSLKTPDEPQFIFSNHLDHYRLCAPSIYTVLEPAPGADGKECMLLTVAQNLSGSAQQLLDSPEFMGFSVVLSVLKQLQHRVGWMSKSLVLLVVDEDFTGRETENLHVGVKSFIDDYDLNTLDLLDR